MGVVMPHVIALRLAFLMTTVVMLIVAAMCATDDSLSSEREPVRDTLSPSAASTPTPEWLREVFQRSLHHSEACELWRLPYPIREVRVPLVTGPDYTIPPYRLFVYPDEMDRDVSSALWGALGHCKRIYADFFESAFHGTFSDAVNSAVSRRLSMQLSGEALRPLVLDLGANIGLHSLYFAAIGAHVFAFEPHPLNYNILRCSASVNLESVWSRLHVYPLALDKETSNTTSKCMTIEAVENMASRRVTDAAASGTGHCETDFVRTVTLDDFWRSPHGLDRRRVDVLKIDLEGYDYYAVLGGEEMFREAPPHELFVEYSVRHLRDAGVANPFDYLRWIKRHGYCLDMLSVSFQQPYSIVRREKEKEMLDALAAVDPTDPASPPYYDLHFVLDE